MRGVQARLALAVGALALASLVPAAAAAAPSTHGSKDVAPLVDQVFKQQRHRFCHDPSYPLTQEELEWCALLPAKDTRCPSLRRACAAGVRAELVGQQQKLELKLPELPAFASVILWVLLGCLAVLVIGMLIRQAMGWSRPPDADTGAREAGPVRPDADAALAAAVETDVMRLLERARAAAAARRLPAGHRGGLRRPAAQAGGLEPDPGGGAPDQRGLSARPGPAAAGVAAAGEAGGRGGGADRVRGRRARRRPVPLGARPGAGAGDRADAGGPGGAGPAGGGRWVPARAGSVGRLPFGPIGVAGSVAGKRHSGERAHLRSGARA